ncbi:uncharacterized protein LOC126325830 [Schistocerca gregaria]|uniref:uncharacterized protein LOC126325830 n=1 Tax=Schistocerca gregaria TaxID=7010 RepID=UPI00211F4513|nr:uncharacterized protein LOC126325830 [Schistocerca gregaria]
MYNYAGTNYEFREHKVNKEQNQASSTTSIIDVPKLGAIPQSVSVSSKRVSPLWLHFEDDGRCASCLYCNSKLIHHSSTTPLKNHLIAKHPERLPSNMYLQIPRTIRAKNSKNFLEKDILKALIKDVRPISELEGALAKIVLSLSCNWEHPKEVVRQSLDIFYREYQDKLSNLIKTHCLGLSLALDIWKLNKYPKAYYLGVYGQFLTSSFQVVSLALGVEYLRDFTMPVIFKAINDVLSTYSLSSQHVYYVVAPFLPEFTELGRVCKAMNVPLIECLTGFLKKLVNEILLPYASLLDKIRSFVSQIKCDRYLRGRFLSMQTARPHPFNLIHDNPDHMFSTCDMLLRFNTLRSEIVSFTEDINSRYTLPVFEDEEWNTSSSIVQHFLRLRELSEEMNSEKYLYGSSSTISISGWIRYQQQNVLDPVIDKLRLASLEAFAQRTSNPASPFIIAAALDPRWKHLPCWNTDYVNMIRERVQLELDALSVSSGSSFGDHGFDPVHKYQKLYETNLDGCKEYDELKAYNAEPRIGFNDDPIRWWTERSSKYPKLAHLARKYLSVPTSASFSSVMKTKMAALGPNVVREIVTLNRNMDILDFIYSTEPLSES